MRPKSEVLPLWKVFQRFHNLPSSPHDEVGLSMFERFRTKQANPRQTFAPAGGIFMYGPVVTGL